jgi:hypothetical protein
MHSVVEQILESYEQAARQQGTPAAYLNRLAPLHDRWHRFSRGARPIGFLLFHWHLIKHFKGAGLEQPMGVAAYEVADFSPGGDFAQAQWPAWMGGVADAQDLQGLADYSLAIERWHNVEGHMVVGMVTGRGEDMMDPLVNIFFPEFWRLHYFINDRFEEQLAFYAEGTHPDLGLTTATEIVDHIEQTHHQALAFV